MVTLRLELRPSGFVGVVCLGAIVVIVSAQYRFDRRDELRNILRATESEEQGEKV